MENNGSYDVRGKQSSIFRLYGFDREGLIHMLFYRIAIFIALALAASIILGFLYFGNPFTAYSKALILALWILFTPQLFETSKAMIVIASDGIVFGRLNDSFVRFGARKSRIYPVYRVLPYAVLLVWAVGFASVVLLWYL